MKKPQIKPLGENILVKIQEPSVKTETGIYLPETASEEKPQEGVVVAIGKSKDIEVKKDQKVIFRRYSGTEVENGGEQFLIIKSEDVLAVIE